MPFTPQPVLKLTVFCCVLSVVLAAASAMAQSGTNRDYDLHGIWQPVALEIGRAGRIDEAWFIPSLDSAEVRVSASAIGSPTEGRISAKWTA